MLPDIVPVRFTGVTTRLSGPKCCHPAPMLYVLTTEPGSASSFAFSETTEAPGGEVADRDEPLGRRVGGLVHDGQRVGRQAGHRV